MSYHVYWSLDLAINEGQLDAFKALMGEMVEGTLQEEGALAYEWAISEDGKAVHIYERYVDSAATMIHLQTFGEKFAERFLACVDPTRFMVYGDPSAEVRAAMAGLGAAHMAQFNGFTR